LAFSHKIEKLLVLTEPPLCSLCATQRHPEKATPGLIRAGKSSTPPILYPQAFCVSERRIVTFDVNQRPRDTASMFKVVLTLTALFSLISFCWFPEPVRADGIPIARHIKKVRPVCQGPHCGPHAQCGTRCRVVCPDRYSCYPLYGAYGPYGGTGYWGAYTLSGWGPIR
jgi:hypothetical protein